MKNNNARLNPRPTIHASAKPKADRGHHIIDTVVKEGDLITFAPTGEKLRVTKIEGGLITFEKSP